MSYPSHFDCMRAPDGWRVLDFCMFCGDDSKSTIELVTWFLAQMGESSTLDIMNVGRFPLSLTNTTFAWFITSLFACSIHSWAQLEEKFHEHFIMESMKLSFFTSYIGS